MGAVTVCSPRSTESRFRCHYFCLSVTKMSCKVDDGLKKEIEAGKALKDVPNPETKLNSHDVTLFAVENFNKDKLKGVKTDEKIILPTAEDIAAEKAESS